MPQPEIIWVEHCESTQATLNEMLAPGQRLAIATFRQVSGKGREDRRWVSWGSRPIALSFGHAVSMSVEKIRYLPRILGSEVADLCSQLLPPGKEANFVEPNDVEVCGKKVAGILVDTRTLGDECLRVSVGVGLNLDGDVGFVDGREITSLQAEGYVDPISQADFTNVLLTRLWPHVESSDS